MKQLNKRFLSIFLYGLSLALFSASYAENSQKRVYPLHKLEQKTLKVDGKTLKLWIMDTKAKQQEGMMYLGPRDIPANHGMLFVFSEPRRLAFWMKNTFVPLDLIFLDQNKKVLNIEQLRPHDPIPVPSNGLALYAIEVPAGLAKKFRIEPGKHLPL